MRRTGGTAFAVAAALLLAVAAATLASGARRGTFAARYSTYQAGPEGTLALHRLLERLGYRPSREQAELLLLSGPGLLVIVEPERPQLLDERVFKPREVEAIRKWLRGGRAMLYLASGPSELLDALEVHVVEAHARATGPAAPDLPSAYAKGVPALETATASYLDCARPDAVPLFARDGKPQAIALTEGGGRAVVVADAEIATNRGIGRASNLRFLLNVVEAHAAGGEVYFDEHHHGFGEERTVVGYLRANGLELALLQGLLLAALWGWRAGPLGLRPRGAAGEKGDEDAAPRGSRELVQAMALIHAKAGLTREATGAVWKEAERRVAKALGAAEVPRGPELGEALRRLGVRNYRGFEALEERMRELSLRKRRPSEAEALAFAGEVARFEALVEEARRAARGRA